MSGEELPKGCNLHYLLLKHNIELSSFPFLYPNLLPEKVRVSFLDTHIYTNTNIHTGYKAVYVYFRKPYRFVLALFKINK